MNDETNERAFFRRLADGAISREEFAGLQLRLADDEACRARYILFMDLEAGLYEEMGAIPDVSRSPLVAQSPRRSRLSATVTVGLVVGLAFGLMVQRPFRPQEATRFDPLAIEKIEVNDQPYGAGDRFVEFESEPQQDPAVVALITYADLEDIGNQTSFLKPGAGITPGTLRLQSGTVQLDFLNGAQLMLQGPSVLQIHSIDAVTLISGNAVGRVPRTARGFIVNTPDAAVVDLGTEFTVNVDGNGQSEIQVTEGEVEVSLLGEDGSTLLSERLRQSTARRVHRAQGILERIDIPTQGPLAFPVRDPPPLQASREYVRLVRDGDPVVYWRFDSVVEGCVPNQMGPEYPARIHGSTGDAPPIVIERGVARFSPSRSPRHLTVDGGVPGWNRSSFSIELWVYPHRLHHGTLVDVIPEDRVGDLNSIELALKTSLVHPAGAIRFFHRHPPARSPKRGVNLFDRGTCIPGQWHHIVAVKTPDDLSLYVNGELVRRISGPTGSDADTYEILFGQMEFDSTSRQFDGGLAEVALYLRPLSDTEIASHYQVMIDGISRAR